MRGDMPKVIVERPRRGGGKLRREKTFRDDDAALRKIGVRRDARMRGADKSLNENLAPLRRYLARQVGRPWDDVWSEICANLRPSNTVQQHVRDHIPDFVAIKTSLRNGEVWTHSRWGFGPLKESWQRYYVDPPSGVLRPNEHHRFWTAKRKVEREAREKERATRLRVVADDKQLHLFDGDWWEVTLAPIRQGWEIRKVGDQDRRVWVQHFEPDVVLCSRFGRLSCDDLYGRSDVRAVAKRQLSRKEVRDWGLPRVH